MFMYKLNFLNLKENNWHGSKICLKKNFKSPQWLRDFKFKKYPFWRLDKPQNIQIIEDGGWHFAYLQNPENISKKIKSFAHGEFNKDHLFGFEAAAWYWHFVDVVWLFLFAAIYIWGS